MVCRAYATIWTTFHANGKITVENHSGEKLNGKKAVKSQLEDWQKLNIPERGKHREASISSYPCLPEHLHRQY